MRFPCMANHDLYAEAVLCSSPQLDNQGQISMQDPMDLDLHSPMPQGQFPQSQTSQKPRDNSGHFGTAGPSIQNLITPLLKLGFYQQQFGLSTVSTSSTSLTNNASSKLSHMTPNTQPQSAATESQSHKRKIEQTH